jgi:hypothetical protein
MWRLITVPPRIIRYTTTGAPTRITTHILGNKVPRPTRIHITTIRITIIPTTTIHTIASPVITITTITTTDIESFLLTSNLLIL